MKQLFKEVFVVEGNHDKSRLKSIFPKIDVVITNGKEISQKTLDLLKALNQSRGLILMLDPDYPGESIRKIINAFVGPTKHIFLDKKRCIDYAKHKVGLEHADLDYLKTQIEDHILESHLELNEIAMKDMIRLNLAGSPQAKKLREKLTQHFHLGECNAKTLLKRLNMFNISEEEIKKVIR